MSDTKFSYTVMNEAWWNSVINDGVTDKRPNLMVSAKATATGRDYGWEFQIEQYDWNNGGTAVRVNLFDDAFNAWVDAPELFTALREQAPKTLAEVRAILDDLGAEDTTERDIPESVKARMQTRRDAVRAVVHDDELVGRIIAVLDDFDARNSVDA